VTPSSSALEAHTALKAFAADYARREAELERAVEKLRADRDAAVCAAFDNGMSIREIAAVMSRPASETL
jgi:DNA-directed RNA polymerase specialized sigma24 family protein